MENDPNTAPPTEPTESVFDPLAERPKWPTVIGIVDIVWAALGIGCSGCSVAGLLIGGGAIQDMMNGDPLPPNLQLSGSVYAMIAVGICIAGLLLIAGITLLSRAEISRSLHLLYGVIGVIGAGITVWYSYSQQVAMNDWAQQYPNNPIAQGHLNQNSAVKAATIVITALFSAAWPGFVLVWFGFHKSRASDITVGKHQQAA